MKNKQKKHILLKGEGVNQHTLYGDFQIEEKEEFSELSLNSNGILRHEQPDGSFGEHQPLQIQKGDWVMGRQVEYNPFNQNISRVWD